MIAMNNELLTQNKSLFISAGHSDSDPGAAGNGVTEANVVMELRDLVAEELRGRLEFSVDGPGNLPLHEAVKLAAQHDLAVEFHCNASESSKATGVETLSKPEGYALGRALCETVASILHIPNRGAKPEGSGQHSRLAFVSGGGGIILELFFLSNPSDLAKYRQRRFDLAAALATTLASAACEDW